MTSSGLTVANILINNGKHLLKIYKKIRYKLFPLNFDIAISIKSEDGLNSGQYYKQLNNDFAKLLNDHNLSKKLIIKNLSDIIVFSNNEEALKFVKKKNINLLIWGDFSMDKLKENDEYVSQLDLKLTYLHPNDNLNLIGNSINKDISSKNKFKGDWKIYDKNSFTDVKLISRNIFDISIYTIALTLKFFNYWDLSTDLFEKLYESNIKDVQFKNSIKIHLHNNYDILTFYNTYQKPDYKKAEIYLNKILALDPNNVLTLSNLALCKFKNNNIRDAEILIDKAFKQNPNITICQINFAYLCIRKKNYKKAYRMYQKFFDHNSVDFEPLEVIDFLESEYKILKDPALIYGSAIMNYIFKDRGLAIKDLKRFLKKADKIKMKEMIKRASQLIN